MEIHWTDNQVRDFIDWYEENFITCRDDSDQGTFCAPLNKLYDDCRKSQVM